MHYRNHSDTTPIDQLARRRAGAKLGWYLHAGIYIAVNILLAVLSAQSGRHWAELTAMSWNLGLEINGMEVWLKLMQHGFYARMVARERAVLEKSGAADPW